MEVSQLALELSNLHGILDQFFPKDSKSSKGMFQGQSDVLSKGAGIDSLNDAFRDAYLDLVDCVTEDQEAVKYSFSRRVLCLEQLATKCRSLAAKHSELTTLENDKIKNEFGRLGCCININAEMTRQIWTSKFERGF